MVSVSPYVIPDSSANDTDLNGQYFESVGYTARKELLGFTLREVQNLEAILDVANLAGEKTYGRVYMTR